MKPEHFVYYNREADVLFLMGCFWRKTRLRAWEGVYIGEL